MSRQRKAPAGGIVRECLDTTWRTPEWLLERVRVYFCGEIPFDPATGADNPTQAARFCSGPHETKEQVAQGGLFGASAAQRGGGDLGNGLTIGWGWPAWVNPPYGRDLRLWLEKIAREASAAAEIVALLPCSRWEQGYFHDTLGAANALCFVRGRVGFVSAIDGVAVAGNPYASMLVGFNARRRLWVEAFGPIGPCYAIEPLVEAPPRSAERNRR